MSETYTKYTFSINPPVVIAGEVDIKIDTVLAKDLDKAKEILANSHPHSSARKYELIEQMEIQLFQKDMMSDSDPYYNMVKELLK